MKKKFVCTVCGYVHEGNEAPAECPVCHVKADKFKEVKEDELNFVVEHKIGVAADCDEEMKKDLNAHWMGECSEVGRYLAMSRQAVKAIPKLLKLSSATLLRRLTTLQDSANCSATMFGILRPTFTSV